MRPRPLPESTSDTVDCETPARRATSTLVTRVGALMGLILGSRRGRREPDRGGRRGRGTRSARAPPPRRRGAARRGGLRAGGGPALLGRAVAELARPRA